MASLSVTAMAAMGGSVGAWFVVLSLLAAVVVAVLWRMYPHIRPWARDQHRPRMLLLSTITLGVGIAVAGFGLSILKAQLLGFDARTIWMLHPIWYLDGHATTVAALRNPALAFSHPPYPPLVGGAVAMSWLVSGAHTARMGQVTVALLGGCAIFAAASAMVELARRLALSGDGRRRTGMLAVGVVATGLLMLVVFSVSRANVADGYADTLWSAAAVGAVAFGLVLPEEDRNLGAAALLAAVAGLTKLEGSLTATAIVGLVAARLFVNERSIDRTRAWLRAGTLAAGTWLVIGIWPIVIRLDGALPNVLVGGGREGSDAYRLHASVVAAWSSLQILALAVPVAVVGGLLLGRTRRRAGVGNDWWAWAALAAELVFVMYAYTTGPDDIHGWLHSSIRRTTFFPELTGWWIVTTWAVLAVADVWPAPVAPSPPPSVDQSLSSEFVSTS
jgi:hypothetical protein